MWAHEYMCTSTKNCSATSDRNYLPIIMTVQHIVHLVAAKLCDRYGCLRLSIGAAMRRVMTLFSSTELARQLRVHLQAGEIVPEELCVLALESALLDVQCTTRGYVCYASFS